MEEKRKLTDKFMLRLPDGMRERIKNVAELNYRSMNAEILATLEEAYPVPPAHSPTDDAIDLVLADGVRRVVRRDGNVLSISRDANGQAVIFVVTDEEMKDIY